MDPTLFDLETQAFTNRDAGDETSEICFCGRCMSPVSDTARHCWQCGQDLTVRSPFVEGGR